MAQKMKDKPKNMGKTPQQQQSHSNPGNFANDRQKASEAGRKGGKASGSHNMGSAKN